MPKPISTPPTTAKSFGALLKSARDIMRKNKGLNGDLDRAFIRLHVISVFAALRRDESAKQDGEL